MTARAETIIAVATAPGRAGVAVLRVSGPQAGALATALTGRPLPAPRLAAYASFSDPATGALLDRGLLLWFPSPASFTGEDVAEFQVHGSRAVLAALLAAATGFPGVRLAEPGEFTRRAFDNGKLDLTEVEGLADLIDAETEAQRRQAVRQLDGALGQIILGWQARLMRALAHCEATIDFVEEEDVPDDLLSATRPDLTALLAEMRGQAADGRGERLRQGLTIVILGPPNAGKSSLLNALAGREAAIVSDRAGTTRDVIELHLDLGGYPVTLVDTAGLRATDDPIEAEGIRRARARADQADLALVLLDRADWPRVPDDVAPWLDQPGTLRLLTKCDAGIAPPADAGGWLPLSVRDGIGFDALMQALTDRAAALLSTGADPLLTRARHRAALAETCAALDRALSGTLPELITEDVRLALRGLGRIVGRVDVEDILGLIFAEFCIGK